MTLFTAFSGISDPVETFSTLTRAENTSSVELNYVIHSSLQRYGSIQKRGDASSVNYRRQVKTDFNV
jgi:hypothetical protein